MKVAAFDLSLTATGVAIAHDKKDLTVTFSTLKPHNLVGMPRLRWISSNVMTQCKDADLVVFEGLAFGKNDPSAQERAGLAYLIRFELWMTARPFVLIAPTSLKKFITGKGNAEKSLVIREVYRRWGCEVSNDNEADACGLAVIGKCLLREHEPENEPQREVIATIRKSNSDLLIAA